MELDSVIALPGGPLGNIGFGSAGNVITGGESGGRRLPNTRGCGIDVGAGGTWTGGTMIQVTVSRVSGRNPSNVRTLSNSPTKAT